MSAAVDFQTFELDGQVHDLMWCGAQDEIVLLQSSDGTVYRSRDRGSSWKKLSGLMNKQGYQVIDDDQEVSAQQWRLNSLFFTDRQSPQNGSKPER